MAGAAYYKDKISKYVRKDLHAKIDAINKVIHAEDTNQGEPQGGLNLSQKATVHAMSSMISKQTSMTEIKNTVKTAVTNSLKATSTQSVDALSGLMTAGILMIIIPILGVILFGILVYKGFKALNPVARMVSPIGRRQFAGGPARP